MAFVDKVLRGPYATRGVLAPPFHNRPEFRLHNAVFAYRNLIGTAVALLNLWPSNPVLAVVTKAALVLGACLAADACTSYIGDRERRTTNAMPYPDHAPAEGMKWTKLFYARAQFYAAMWAISGMATMSFLCVFAIEIASFLMTLVRKGWIAPLSYHRAYYFALWIMWPVVIASMAFGVLDAGHVCTVGATTKAIYMARVKGRVSKYILWPLGAAIAAIGLLYVPTGLLSQPLLCVITIATGLEYVYCSRWLLQREPRAGAATTSVSAAPGSASAPGKSREHEAPQPSWQRTLGRLVSCERVRRMASGH